MRPMRGSVVRLAVPLKALVQRMALVLLIGAAATLLVLGRADVAAIERARAYVNDTIAPVLDVLSRPAEAVATVVDEVRYLTALRTDNAELRDANDNLVRWQAEARRLERENAVLRALLKTADEAQDQRIAARVIGDFSGAYARSVIVNAGARDGVRKGQAVVTSAGLAGRVAEVGKRSARVLLLTDISSRLPVILEATRQRAILAGDNSSHPKIIYLPINARVRAGDRVVTSGHGGVFPPGLAVGIVSSSGEGTVRVQPLIDWDRLEYLTILDYPLPGILAAPGEPGSPRAAKRGRR